MLKNFLLLGIFSAPNYSRNSLIPRNNSRASSADIVRHRPIFAPMRVERLRKNVLEKLLTSRVQKFLIEL